MATNIYKRREYLITLPLSSVTFSLAKYTLWLQNGRGTILGDDFFFKCSLHEHPHWMGKHKQYPRFGMSGISNSELQ